MKAHLERREKNIMKLYLAGGRAVPRAIQSCLAVQNKDVSSDSSFREYSHKLYILESFYYMNDKVKESIPCYRDFFLDSGAFTFMQNSKAHTDFDRYAEEYADFIKGNGIKKFFELDIDSVVGYAKVKQIRKNLEQRTGRQCVPVWHKSRGKEEFIRMCKEYSYVALGGIASGEFRRNEYKYFPWFIKTAHDNGAKIHGLGFTSLSGLKKYHFDSVDSTSWISGSQYGHLYKFDGKTMRIIGRPKNHRLADYKKAMANNFIEWCKFQRYAENKL
jgi:hypothetical protein